jgi:hypothetical protein
LKGIVATQVGFHQEEGWHSSSSGEGEQFLEIQAVMFWYKIMFVEEHGSGVERVKQRVVFVKAIVKADRHLVFLLLDVFE